MTETTRHWNFASTKISDFLADLPWGFETVCLGETLMATFPEGLIARITVKEGDTDKTDKTARQILGFHVEIISRRTGPLIEQLFRLSDFETDEVKEEKIRLRKSGTGLAWAGEDGKTQKTNDRFMLPICRAVFVFLKLATSGTLPPDPQSNGAEPTDELSGGVVALVDDDAAAVPGPAHT